MFGVTAELTNIGKRSCESFCDHRIDETHQMIQDGLGVV